jgi:hypothetical protein
MMIEQQILVSPTLALSTEDISILTKPEENLALIMKDGKIYKNTVH